MLRADVEAKDGSFVKGNVQLTGAQYARGQRFADLTTMNVGKPFAIVGSGRLMRNVGRLVIVQRVRMIVMMHMRRRSRDRSVVTAHMRTPSYTRNYQRAKQSEEQQTDHVVADTIILDRGNANDDRSSDDFLST